jgi:hypothetical protein
MKFNSSFLSCSLFLLLACFASGAAKPGAPTQPDKVLAVGTDTVTVQTLPKAGFKVTDIDIDGKSTVKAPGNHTIFHVLPTTQITVDGLPSKLADVRAGMKVAVVSASTPTDAASIIAYTIPPPARPAATPLNWKPIKGRKFAKAAFRKISKEKVLSIKPDRITVAQDGASKAVAYLISPLTAITVNGQAAQATAIRVGMSVYVNAADQTTAASIAASDEDK